MLNHRFRFAFVAGLLAAAFAHAGVNRWTRGSPDWGPAYVTQTWVHPRNPRVVFANGDRFWRSDDGGTTWSRLPVLPFYPQTLALDPRSERILFTDGPSGGVRRSTDGGQTWEDMTAPDTSPPGVDLLVIGASAPDVLFAYAPNPEIGVYRSRDSGATWQFILPTESWVSIAVDPADGRVVYVTARHLGVLKSLDGGDTWTPSNGGLLPLAADSIAIDSGNSRILHLVNEGFLYQSTDAGASWRRSATAAEQMAEVVSQIGVAGSAYAHSEYSDPRLYRTTDYGATWNPVALPDAARIYDVAPAPGLPDRVYAAAISLLSTSDGGATWKTLGEGPPRVAGGIVVSPFEPKTVYAAGGTQRVSASFDGGRTWSPRANVGLDWIQTNNLEVSRSTPETVYAGTTDGIFRTRDRGDSWEHVDGTAGNDRVVLDPLDSNRLISVNERCNRFACYATSRLSSDGGATWTTIQSPSSDPYYLGFWAELLTGSSPQVLLGHADGSLVRGEPAGPVEFVEGSPVLRLLAANPLDPAVIFGVGWFPGDAFTSLMHSGDIGATWTRVGPINTQTVYDLAIDPLDPAHMAVATDFDGVLRSTDGGNTWLRFNEGLPEPSIRSVAFSSDGRTLYAGTAYAVYVYEFCDDCTPRVEPDRPRPRVATRSSD